MGVRDADHRTVEANLATNLRQIREDHGLSQEQLAARMTERGFGFSQATIWKIEQGKRPVKISEAVALADAVGFDFWTTLLNPPGSASHYLRLQAANRKASEAYAALKVAAAQYVQTQLEMSLTGHLARESGEISESLIEHWTDWLTMPGERAVLEARIGDGREEELSGQIDDEVEQVIQTLRDRGYEPFFDMDSWQSSDDINRAAADGAG